MEKLELVHFVNQYPKIENPKTDKDGDEHDQYQQGDRLKIEGKVYVITLDHNLDFVLSLVRDEK